MDFLNLDPLLELALKEDIGRGDLTTDSIVTVAGDPPLTARVVAKQPLVVAGWPVFARVFQLLDAGVEFASHVAEGEFLESGLIGSVSGRASSLLKGERVALNLFQRASGIASQTRNWVKLAGDHPVKLLDTRKTTPLWRILDKYAVRMGGGHNHRMGLDDAVLIKENHIELAGGLTAAVEACRKHSSHLSKIEVEVQSLEQLQEALALSVDIVLLDNMSPEEVRQAVRINSGACLLEASGGINDENLAAYAATGVDYISLGALTHSFRSADISMLFG